MKRILSKYKCAVLSVCVLYLCYLMFYHHTKSYEFGIRYNVITGELSSDAHTGHHFTPPWVFVTKIDTRPRKVGIASVSRTTNYRLVQFDKTHWRDLVEKEGFHYYWWYNRFSFSWSQETYRGIDNLFLGYAYGDSCSFLIVLEKIGE